MTGIPIGLQSWPGGSDVLTVERLQNCYAEEAPATAESPVIIRGVPGLDEWSDVGTNGIRGLHYFDGVLYAVDGTDVYSIDSVGVATSIGTISSGTDPVSFTGYVNDLVAPRVSVLVIGAGANAYTYDVTGGTFAQIADADLTGAAWVDILDNFVIFGADNVGQFQWSALLDATDIDALDFATAEGHPDPVVRGIVDHRELILFGEETTEVFYNTGVADNRFLRAGSGLIERGCAARWSVAKEDNTVFWLGDDRIVYRLDGRTPLRLSQHGVEEEWRKYSTVDDAEAFFHTWNGHKFYTLTFPTENATWCLDLNTGLWHERSTFGVGRWRSRGGVSAYGKVLVGDYNTGKIYQLDEDTHTDAGGTLEWLLQTPPVHSARHRVHMHRMDARFQAGVGTIGGQGADPLIALEWTDDGGTTWSNKHYRSLGTIGEYAHRVYWTRIGQFRSRSFRFTGTDPVIHRLIGVEAQLERGIL